MNWRDWVLPPDRCPVLEDDEDSSWRYDWQAGIHLADALGDTTPCQGKRVLDLGCGRGACGCAALLAEAREVVFVDRCEALIQALVKKLAYRWVQAGFLATSWAQLRVEPADLICCGDVCYDPQTHDELLACIARHLAPRGCAILALPARHVPAGLRRKIPAHGLEVFSERSSEDTVFLTLGACFPLCSQKHDTDGV